MGPKSNKKSKILHPYSEVSIHPQFKGLAELFRMSGSINNSNIGDNTLSNIVAELKSKWNNELKTNIVEHLHQGLIEHITGLKESMTVIFENKTLSEGQMLLFDTANRKVSFNKNISDQYKALDTEISVVDGYQGIEYILVNPRLVLTSNVNIEKHQAENKSLKQIIGERIAKNPSQNLINSIGINRVEGQNPELKYAIVNRANSKDNLPMFDEDITVFMLGDYKGPDVSIGVNRGNFDYNTISEKVDTLLNFINPSDDNGEEVDLNSVLKNYKQQITDQYNTISSLFTGENVQQDNKYIYNVLPKRPNIKVGANLNNEIRQRFEYCIFRWMELYYNFYVFCPERQPIKKVSKKTKHTIRDPLNRCVDTLEYRIYKYQTDGIKLFLLSLFFGLYKIDNDDSPKQIYTPEMLLYDIGRIIETPPENLSQDVFFRRQSRTSSEGSNSSRRASSRTDSTNLKIQNLDDNSLPNQNSPQSNSDTSRSNSVSSSHQESAHSMFSSRDSESSRGSESGKNLELNFLQKPDNHQNESNSLDLNTWTNANHSEDESGVSEQVVSDNDDESEDAQSVYSDSSRPITPINVKKEIENFDYTKMLSPETPPSLMNNPKESTPRPNSLYQAAFKPLQQLATNNKSSQPVKLPKKTDNDNLNTRLHVNGPNGVNPRWKPP
jgi:hypothetical protein